tara:strand:+ start:230 stop:478 length:249 start_codon:yes stop_codon:yes gene_type:complete
MATVLEKNSRESLVINQSEFKGVKLVDVRVFYKDENGDLKPTKKGVSVRLEQLDALIKSLSEVSATAREQKLVGENGTSTVS